IVWIAEAGCQGGSASGSSFEKAVLCGRRRLGGDFVAQRGEQRLDRLLASACQLMPVDANCGDRMTGGDTDRPGTVPQAAARQDASGAFERDGDDRRSGFDSGGE